MMAEEGPRAPWPGKGDEPLSWGKAKPRNPGHFRRIKGGRKRVPDTLLAKTVFDALRGAQPLFHDVSCTVLPSKHCLGHFWALPLMKPGYGARQGLHQGVGDGDEA